MNDKDFMDFINTSTTKGGATFNLKTQNTSKTARNILQNTQYKMLAKQHINSNVVHAYYNNAQFKAKLDDVMAKLNIAVIA